MTDDSCETAAERADSSVAAIHPRVAIGAAYAWRLIVIGLFVFGVLWVAGQLLVVLVPIGIATLLTRALFPVFTLLRHRRVPAGLAAAMTVMGFVLVLGGALGLVGWSVAGEVDNLPTTLDRGVDDITDLVIEHGPFDVTRAEVERWRAEAGDALSGFVRSVGGSGSSNAVLVGELLVGTVLALVLTFFFLKDGRRFSARLTLLLPVRQRPTGQYMLDRAWAALGGYLRGAAMLGLFESLAIGAAMLLAGAGLIPAVMLVTFVAAFVPLVGAIAAGVIAVLVTLVTAGTVPALIVGAVVLVVQQLDNDVLAPVIYGRAVRLHPLTVLVGIAAGGALFGFVGTVFAVPALAVGLNAADEARRQREAGSSSGH